MNLISTTPATDIWDEDFISEVNVETLSEEDSLMYSEAE